MEKLLQMYLGEKKKITIEITSAKGESFEIDNAKTELFLLTNNVMVHDHQCDCIVTENKICCTICPIKEGLYILKLTLTIADEIVIKKFQITVDD